jgi:hypothetical protein
MNRHNRCPHCGEGDLKNWHDLDEEEREVVNRLPAATDYSLVERQRNHLWCTRCWFESVDNQSNA